ncbi:glycoside hydrolase family 5 protein [Lactimicrobium massiliense]|uniref:glycoside hydrolase family 5 protein n=1 Tax=Lactimicrobium massiliense TaxID=2161814 RepID=UPI000D55BA2E|nr:cellulase family glycosylhydrolase [Lactimicrobium massiliense]
MQYLKTGNQRIVNEANEEIILQGYAAGNWMVQEAFLFGTGGFHADFKPFMRAQGMDRPRTIHQAIIETCGTKYAESFWHRYYRNYFAEEDIRHLKETGFNSVRLPFLARAFLKEEPEIVWDEENFAMLDRIIDWCEQYGIYVILDMHAAYAGQSTVGCDDGVDNYPHLFTDEEGRARSILVWKKLAERYKDRSVIAGYELLNEPLALPKWDNYIPELLEFYRECIKEIRSVDRNHMIFLQGHRFAKRADIFEEDMDPVCHNWVLTFHIYETLPDLGLLGPIMAERERLNVPVWVGETGGTKHWLTVLSSMLYENHIGINVWCHKAVSRPNAPTLCTYEVPEDFHRVTDYIQKGASKPSFKEAIEIFDQYLENVKFENCTLHEEEAYAVLRSVPVMIPAVGYDWDPASHKGNYPYCSFSGYRREDHLKMILPDGKRAYEHAEFKGISFEPIPKYGDYNRLALVLREGEYAAYTILSSKDSVQLTIDGQCSNGAQLTIEACGAEYHLQKGQNTIVLSGLKNGRIPVKLICESGEVSFRTLHFE